MSTAKTELPDIFEYLDFRAYLKDWLAAKKEAWPDHSYEVFARNAGLTSKATVHNVITGRRNPRPETVDAFATALDLNRAEAAFLQKLVDMATARTLEERRSVLESILEESIFNQNRVLDDDDATELLSQFYSRWYCMPIRELATGKDFVADPVWISSIIMPKITVAQAAEGLEILFALGMLQENEDGGITVPEIRVSTGTAPSNKAIYKLYTSHLQNAIHALNTVPPHERHYNTGTLLVSEDLLPELKARLDQFARTIGALGDDNPPPGARVYLFSSQLYPLTATPRPLKEE
jgi:uncharacterized protein (TIGR02147 family)